MLLGTLLIITQHPSVIDLFITSYFADNIMQVTAEDIVMAEKLFGAVSQKAAEYLPNFRLLSLLPETRYF